MLFFPFFAIGKLFYVIILVINAITILSEDRFLARIGWGRAAQTADPGFGSTHDPTSIKSKIVDLISSVRMVARIPLIAINALIIIYELVLG